MLVSMVYSRLEQDGGRANTRQFMVVHDLCVVAVSSVSSPRGIRIPDGTWAHGRQNVLETKKGDL